MHIRGILLDIDGTLLDSNDAHASAWVDALAEFGVHRPVRELRRLVGMGADQLLTQIGLADDERGQAIAERRKELFQSRFLPGLRPFSGTRELLEEVARRGLTRVVATSASAEEIPLLLRAARIEDLIEKKTSSDDAAASKPAPDIVEAAAARSGLPPEELVMLGDTPYDVQAARGAGVAVIALRCGGWDDAHLVGAAAIYDGPADLLARIDDSPLGHM